MAFLLTICASLTLLIIWPLLLCQYRFCLNNQVTVDSRILDMPVHAHFHVSAPSYLLPLPTMGYQENIRLEIKNAGWNLMLDSN